MSYGVYRVESDMGDMVDPDIPRPAYHQVIFVETGPAGTGFIHHVTGDVTSHSGMKYEVRAERPEESETFHQKYFLGTVAREDYPDNFNAVLKKCPPPHKQKEYNPKTRKNEQFKSVSDGVYEFYQPGEDRPTMYRCKQWTIQTAIPALKESEVLRTT